jgi:hypothetical protein
MPRSDKPISTGNLTDPIASARSRTWTSHASPEDADAFEPDGTSFVDPLTQEPVAAVVNLLDPSEPVVSIQPPEPRFGRLASRPAFVAVPVYEWTTVRSIEGRTYMRTDERHQVEAED